MDRNAARRLKGASGGGLADAYRSNSIVVRLTHVASSDQFVATG